MRTRLVLRRKLLQRDQRRRQGFRDHPFVVARDSLSWHRPILPSRISRHAPEPQRLPGTACRATCPPAIGKAAQFTNDCAIIGKPRDKPQGGSLAWSHIPFRLNRNGL